MLFVRREHILNTVKQKFKRLLLRETKSLRIVFVGEEAVDSGGPTKEFFTMVFGAIEKNIMFGANSFTFLHDFEKLESVHYKLFGKLISINLLNACTGSSNVIRSVTNILLDCNVDELKIHYHQIPDYEMITSKIGRTASNRK